jgi:pimeloyl-ACP methyl ester carboxylesterase
MATFCLLHGAWHDGSCWESLVERLRAGGHEAVAPDLPDDNREAGFEERVRPALQALEAVSGPLVVVGHSVSSGYAAVVAARRPGSLLVHLCPRLGSVLAAAGRTKHVSQGFPLFAD